MRSKDAQKQLAQHGWDWELFENIMGCVFFFDGLMASEINWGLSSVSASLTD